MIKTFKTLAMALLVTGATVTATKAPAAPVATTNTQIIENISVALTAYAAGTLNTRDTSLTDKTITINTKDVLNVLSSVTGVTFTGTGAAAPKLVYREQYNQPETVSSNELITNISVTLTNTTNLFIVDTNASTNILPMTSSSNVYYSYFVSNGIVSQITNSLPITSNAVPVGTNSDYATLATNDILIGVTNTNTTVAITNLDTNAGFFTTIVPTIVTNGSGSTNVAIETFEATNASQPVFFNTKQSFDVMYGGVGAAAQFLDVSPYFSNSDVTNENSNFNYEVTVESGKNLGDTNETLTTRTKTKIDTLSLAAVGSGTNNLVFNLQGIATDVLKIDNLTVHGNAAEAVKVDSSGSTTFSDLTGVGTMGGTFVTNTVSTNNPGTNAYTLLPNEVPYYGYVGTNTSVLYVGGNTNLGTNYGFLQNPTPIIIKGTITATYLENLP